MCAGNAWPRLPHQSHGDNIAQHGSRGLGVVDAEHEEHTIKRDSDRALLTRVPHPHGPFCTRNCVAAVTRIGAGSSSQTDIGDADAAASGFGSPAEVLSSLRGTSDQSIYKIALYWAGPDPRDGLSAESDLTHDQISEIRQRLRSWTSAVSTARGRTSHCAGSRTIPGNEPVNSPTHSDATQKRSSSTSASSRTSASPAA